MGIEYYAFALFVTAMICLIAILFRLLFADVRRQRKLLEEKESQLLDLYKTVENVMDEFFDDVKAVRRDIQEYEDKMAKLAAAPPPQPVIQPVLPLQTEGMTISATPEPMEKLPRSMTVDASAERIRAAGEVIERAGRVIKGDLARVVENGNNNNNPGFKNIFDKSTNEIQAKDPIVEEKEMRNNTILELASQGKTTADIAKDLGITQNEVNLIINLQKNP